jgi:hypothetical protein
MTTCFACRRPRSAGELLLVVDRHDGSTYALCRPPVSMYCLAAAGDRASTAIALFDVGAARQYDARYEGGAA